jgi:DNA gyrase subunit A
MAKQLNMLPAGQIIATALHTEMQQSYLEYAMSVIVGRALPDARDGLKPVHRRILYAMHELGLTPDRPYRKCARVVGDVLGKYHPHGDQSVYDALVRLVQDFSSRYPLLAGHGNFGSVDDDPPAAMRYTETRLAAVGNEVLLTEIGDGTVEFTGNFDNSQQEPTVLPAQLPILLLNGSSGIAVGMATNIPPHNLGEVVDGLIALIDNPGLTDEKLLELIPGPDFPTGGEIVGTDGIREAYLTGRGSIPIRGVASVEEINVGRGKHRRLAIIVTELPYQLNKAGWIEKVAELVTLGQIEGIADIRDESDREGIRVVIELKRDINPNKILSLLLKKTALQSNFGTIMLALDDSRPVQMTLRQLLQSFLEFRETTLTRRYQNDLTKAESRTHVLEALIAALANLDAIIAILRQAPDGTTAKMQFQAQFGFSDRQSDAILSMPLRRLTGMERQNLQQEFDEIATQIADLRRLLGDRRELLKALKKDLRSLKKQFSDDRRTRIVASDPTPAKGKAAKAATADTATPSTGEAPASAKASAKASATLTPADPSNLFDFEEEVQDVVVELTQRGYVRRLSTKTYERQQAKRNAEPLTKTLEEQEDLTTQTEFTTTQQSLIAVTRSGKAYPIAVRDIPQPAGRNTRGTPLVTLLPASAQAEPGSVVGCLVLAEDLDLEQTWLLIVTSQGRVKRVPLTDLQEITSRGVTLQKLKDEDQLAFVRLVEAGDQVVLATSTGRLLRLEVNDDSLPVLSRTAQGAIAMRLRKQDTLVGCTILGTEDGMLLVSHEGYVKRMLVKSLRRSIPGELGTQIALATKKTDAIAAMVPAFPETEVAVVTSANRIAYLEIDCIDIVNRDDKGKAHFKLNVGETITTVTDPLVFWAEEDDGVE